MYRKSIGEILHHHHEDEFPFDDLLSYVDVTMKTIGSAQMAAIDFDIGLIPSLFPTPITRPANTQIDGTPLAAIDWGTALDGASDPGTLTVNVFLDEDRPTFFIDGLSITATSMTAYERSSVESVFTELSKLIDVNFTYVDNRADADISVIVDAFAGDGTLGIANPPGESGPAGIVALFRDGVGWDQNNDYGGLGPGGYGYLTLIHELAHALGLAHPHDRGGGSDVITGVRDPFEDTGAFSLNQGVFTVMSYIDGYAERSDAQPGGFEALGWSASYAPLDIALLQAKYGARDANTGDDVYQLGAGDAALPGYIAIWDTGGFDTISAAGSTIAATIDLQAASLQYDAIGGGVVSLLSGIVGGYTIANGVEIEAAIGSNVDDSLGGSNGANTLTGAAGADYIRGRGGDDTLVGDLTFALMGAEGEIYRAYQAVFGRAPDAGGFDAFLTAMRLGQTDQAMIVTEFVASAEFQATYGDLSNAAFVELLYTNVLPGNTDAQGRANFTEALDNGSRTRTEVVIEFANSPEFIARTDMLSQGFATNVAINPIEFDVYRIYQAVFQRDPDADGFNAFTNALQAGVASVESVTAEFVASAEFQATYGDLSNADFVELLYTNVLPGNEDQVGRANFTAALDNGSLTRAAMVAEFVDSAEFVARTADAARDYSLTAFAGDGDTLDGEGGNDMLLGGRGADTFVFGSGSDTVVDFTIGLDRLDLLVLGTDFDTVEEIMGAASQDGLDTVFDFGGGNSLRLLNVDMNDLQARDLGLDSGSAQVAVIDDALFI